MPMFGLIDCNNFFASCERVFNPSLNGVPIVVLSNNDGCIISRSEEAKKLGIKMGEPAFKVNEFLETNNVAVFSSNYTLYGDMSNRVMNTLANLAERIEVYSIDEAFIDLRGCEMMNFQDYGRKIVRTIQKNTGIPVSMGIAPTKTLAKAASKYAKKYKGYNGICVIDSEEKRIKALQKLDIEDVWGIGRRLDKMLRYNGIQTAYDLTQRSRSWVRKNMSVTGERTWSELNGNPCIDVDNAVAAKKQICISRSFGTRLEEFDDVFEAVSNFTAMCATKLRRQKSLASGMLVFIIKSPFREQGAQYVDSKHMMLSIPTDNTNELIKYAKSLLGDIFKKGHSYKKAGVIITEILPDTPFQTDLFDEIDRVRQKRLMSTIDDINESYGTHKIRIASQGYGKKWKLKNEKLSPSYTTKLSDIINVMADENYTAKNGNSKDADDSLTQK